MTSSLYIPVTLQLDDGRVTSHYLDSIGFRSIEVERGADGMGFALRVKGLSVFFRHACACWTSADPITLASTDARLRHAFELAPRCGHEHAARGRHDGLRVRYVLRARR
ncbi:hypothetical protein BN2475_130072 [Paraburkholderia ribeironis]|uniref:Uncharacterized protein n=1 Tax=Paraburkholderia ribeironis TaxID=1247936 RepID=A0A1N7RTP1_9BURK|nr:hypothetical protein BN2475_130072 [Paraburkholderia ribeironis]